MDVQEPRSAARAKQEAGGRLLLHMLAATYNKWRREEDETGQLCPFIGSDGGNGKPRVLKAPVKLFKSKEQPNRVLSIDSGGVNQRHHDLDSQDATQRGRTSQ
ncbi:uncharacterized protein MAM_07620 [Metarhizium album ARSEF 1941]|uniref:Uncharacterized protein n=1 Tax=Metarhizium album (strain ARSEF 1941) TaxID=1081103 RepID=A0A0B2WNI5_METAS|nr:uncharacterized protein MAM_07620 [Metarhizium album ARSEF 1941]KHN94565.1 hypothetical protein MAM_07620 [Metarhizium album ARSEF 1941]